MTKQILAFLFCFVRELKVGDGPRQPPTPMMGQDTLASCMASSRGDARAPSPIVDPVRAPSPTRLLPPTLPLC